MQPELRFSQVDLAFGAVALDQAATDFLGPTTRPNTGSGGSGNGVITGGGLQADLGLQDLRGSETAAGLRVVHQMSDHWSMETGLRAGQSDIRRTLPAGSLRLGRLLLLADGRMTARTRFVEAEAIAMRQMPELQPQVLPGRLQLGGGLGVRITQSQLRVTMDTLFPIDARSTSRQTQPFATLQARYGLDRIPAQAFAEARTYGRKSAGLRAGMDFFLP